MYICKYFHFYFIITINKHKQTKIKNNKTKTVYSHTFATKQNNNQYHLFRLVSYLQDFWLHCFQSYLCFVFVFVLFSSIFDNKSDTNTKTNKHKNKWKSKSTTKKKQAYATATKQKYITYLLQCYQNNTKKISSLLCPTKIKSMRILSGQDHNSSTRWIGRIIRRVRCKSRESAAASAQIWASHEEEHSWSLREWMTMRRKIAGCRPDMIFWRNDKTKTLKF